MPYMPFSFLRPRNEDDEMMSPYRKILFDSLPPNSDSELPSPKKDLASVYSGLSGLEDTPEMVAYKEHLLGAPTPEQYKPGKMTRLAAAMAGVSEGWNKGAAEGVNTAQSMIRAPYMRAREEWTQKGAGLGEMANLSRQTMLDRGNLYKATEQARLAAEKHTLDLKNVESQISSRAITAEKGRVEIERIRRQAQTDGYERVNDKESGKSYMVHPVTGHRLELGKFDESAADQRSASARTSWDLFNRQEGVRQQNRIALEDTRFDKSKKMEGIRQEDRKELQTLQSKINLNRDAARANASNSRTGANLLNQNKAAAKSIVSSDPHTYEEMGITVDANGVAVNQDDLDLSTPEKLAKYVAVMNAMYKGVEGASKLTMPQGFDEYGNRKSAYKVTR